MNNKLIRRKRFKKINTNLNKCEHCGNHKLYKKDKYTLCKSCLSIVSVEKTEENKKEEEIINKLLPNYRTRTVISSGSNRIKKVYTYVSISSEERSINKIYNDILEKYTKNISIANGHDVKKAEKDLIIMTIMLYKKIIKFGGTIHRDPLKTGIIAICFQYIAKDNYIIWTNKEISKIFNVEMKHITKGVRIINKLAKIEPEFRKHINRNPITLSDMVEKINFRFPLITYDDLNRLKKIVNRIKETRTALTNTPRPIISGILYNYVKLYNIPISKKEIIEGLSVSDSSITKYSKKFKYVIYKK